MKLIMMFVIIFSTSIICLGEEMKVICASRTETPPVLDGKLDDSCWQKAEIRSDFTSPGAGQKLNRRTTMRVLYDNNSLYFGFEVFWDDIELLKKSVSAIKEKYPHFEQGVWMKEWNYENTYGMEIFVDPGASGRNYYQMLFNAAGQCVGNYTGMLDCFNIRPEITSSINGNCWNVELCYPTKGLKAGQEWGLNVCRNDETYYGIWKQVGGAYGNPKLFGRLVIGDYQEWWNAVGGNDAKTRLEAMKTENERFSKTDSNYPAMVKDTESELEKLHELAMKYPPSSRDNFEQLYAHYGRTQEKFERLYMYHNTLRVMTDSKKTEERK